MVLMSWPVKLTWFTKSDREEALYVLGDSERIGRKHPRVHLIANALQVFDKLPEDDTVSPESHVRYVFDKDCLRPSSLNYLDIA